MRQPERRQSVGNGAQARFDRFHRQIEQLYGRRRQQDRDERPR
jgi:hypothetical protein